MHFISLFLICVSFISCCSSSYAAQVKQIEKNILCLQNSLGSKLFTGTSRVNITRDKQLKKLFPGKTSITKTDIRDKIKVLKQRLIVAKVPTPSTPSIQPTSVSPATPTEPKNEAPQPVVKAEGDDATREEKQTEQPNENEDKDNKQQSEEPKKVDVDPAKVAASKGLLKVVAVIGVIAIPAVIIATILYVKAQTKVPTALPAETLPTEPINLLA